MPLGIYSEQGTASPSWSLHSTRWTSYKCNEEMGSARCSRSESQVPPEVWDEISQTYGVLDIPHGAQEALAKGPATSKKDPLRAFRVSFLVWWTKSWIHYFGEEEHILLLQHISVWSRWRAPLQNLQNSRARSLYPLMPLPGTYSDTCIHMWT